MTGAVLSTVVGLGKVKSHNLIGWQSLQETIYDLRRDNDYAVVIVESKSRAARLRGDVSMSYLVVGTDLIRNDIAISLWYLTDTHERVILIGKGAGQAWRPWHVKEFPEAELHNTDNWELVSEIIPEYWDGGHPEYPVSGCLNPHLGWAEEIDACYARFFRDQDIE